MAKYTSRFKELAFYVKGERKQFRNGEYETTDKAAVSVLDTLADVKAVVEEEVAPKAPKAEAKPVAKAKPAPRKPTAKK